MRNKLCKKISTAILCVCYASCSNPFAETDEEKQARQEAEKARQEIISNLAPCVDGTVKIGNQVWQKCNLNVEPGTGKSSCYKNKADNCEKYGRLYDWAAAMTACPSGWHLPSDAEWDALIAAVGGEKVAGKYLKAKGWNDHRTEALDSYGFAALLGGFGNSDGYFNDTGNYGGWWNATESKTHNAYYQNMYYTSEHIFKGNGSKSFLYSVRCLQD
ncbi:hypothetical protein R83H12_02191 [Fibrobacteria bacterium R8-3-H12]